MVVTEPTFDEWGVGSWDKLQVNQSKVGTLSGVLEYKGGKYVLFEK